MELSENQISFAIRGILLDIHTEYGPGLLENAYEHILFNRLEHEGFDVKRQFPVSIDEDGLRGVELFKIDLLVEDKVILELKSVEKLNKVHFKQLRTYLKLTGIKLGLLINFNEDRILYGGVHRIVNGIEDES